jgi:hypothetical protein
VSWCHLSKPCAGPLSRPIVQPARELVDKRQAWLNPPGATEEELKKRTLTNLYNDYPTWLELAHRTLDEAALDAYGWPHDLDGEEIFRRLLELNLEGVDGLGQPSPCSPDRRASPIRARSLAEGDEPGQSGFKQKQGAGTSLPAA